MVRTATLPGWSCEPGRPTKSRSQTGGLSSLSFFCHSALRQPHTWLWPKDMAGRSGEQPELAAWSPAASPTHTGPDHVLPPTLFVGPVSSTSSTNLCLFPARCSQNPNSFPTKCDQKFNVGQPPSGLNSWVSHKCTSLSQPIHSSRDVHIPCTLQCVPTSLPHSPLALAAAA